MDVKKKPIHIEQVETLVNAYGSKTIAAILGVSDRAIQLWMTDTERDPRRETLKKISELFARHSAGDDLGKGLNHFSRKFLALRNELNLPKNINLYSIKHTRAVHLAEAGASPYSIMQLFRHSSLNVTMIYLRSLGLDVSKEAAELTKL